MTANGCEIMSLNSLGGNTIQCNRETRLAMPTITCNISFLHRQNLFHYIFSARQPTHVFLKYEYVHCVSKARLMNKLA